MDKDARNRKHGSREIREKQVKLTLKDPSTLPVEIKWLNLVRKYKLAPIPHFTYPPFSMAEKPV